MYLEAYGKLKVILWDKKCPVKCIVNNTQIMCSTHQIIMFDFVLIFVVVISKLLEFKMPSKFSFKIPLWDSFEVLSYNIFYPQYFKNFPFLPSILCKIRIYFELVWFCQGRFVIDPDDPNSFRLDNRKKFQYAR